ncbi:MAG: PAS domain S-box protein [Elusimicrobia bacterium]|nr:PAS domain S-box protein [Elusimicrobiota bacterium]
MEPITPEKMDEYLNSSIWGGNAYPKSYPELCADLVTMLSKSSKLAALYTLKHPLVIESVIKAFSLLGQVLAAKRATTLSLSFSADVWLFDGTAVPAVSQDAQNLAALFKSHGLRGVNFLAGVRSFEIGALCEFLGGGAKNQPAGYFAEFLRQRNVTAIRPEVISYVQAGRQEPQPVIKPAAPRPAARPVASQAPRPAVIPAPGIPQRPAAPRAHLPVPAAPPAPRPVEAVPGPGPGPGGGQQGGNILAGMSLGSLLTRLVESAVTNPQERVRVYEDALKMIKESLDHQVAEATKELTKENERILSTRDRTEKVLSKVAEGKVIVDKDGKILMMNPAAEAISGKRLAEVAGTHVSEHLNPGEHFLTLSEDMDLSSGAPVSGKVSQAGDEEVGRALRGSMALLQDDEGRVVGAYTTLPELTKFKEAQRLQEEFLSKITHELQSPLSSISSALEMLTDTANGKLDTDESKFLAISVRNSRRLTEMIRSILDFSKLQSGKLTVHPEPVSLGSMLAEAGDGLLPWAKTKELTLTVRAPVPDVTVLADRTRIIQVLTNLIANAIKSTPKGGSVLVAASRTANPEPGAVVGVRDTGPGIAPENLKKIFQKFVQVDDGGAREGVGLGLAIANELVALHHGKIWAESEQGKGATFYFTIPLGAE